MRLAVAPLLFVASLTQAFAQGVPNPGESALEFANNCRPLITEPSNGDGTFFVADKQLLCWGAMSYVQWAFNLRDAKTEKPMFFACLPTESSRRQLVAVVVSYVDKHPEQGHLKYQTAISYALQTAFPCKK